MSTSTSNTDRVLVYRLCGITPPQEILEDGVLNKWWSLVEEIIPMISDALKSEDKENQYNTDSLQSETHPSMYLVGEL
jgi:hypothetical protein